MLLITVLLYVHLKISKGTHPKVTTFFSLKAIRIFFTTGESLWYWQRVQGMEIMAWKKKINNKNNKLSSLLSSYYHDNPIFNKK